MLKKIIWFFIFLFCLASANMAFCATRTISDAGGDWDNVNTWDEGAVPIAGDDVVAQGDGTSGNVTINVSSACSSIILTNYTGTLTQNADMTTTSTITFVAGMTFTYSSGTWFHNGTATITSGGKAFGAFRFNSTGITVTLADDLDINGLLTVSNTTTVNGNQMKVGGSFTINAVLDGTTTFLIDGTGSWTSNGNAIQTSAITINTAGTLTFAGSFGVIGTTVFTYTSGTIAGTAPLYVTTGSNATLNTSGCTLPGVTFATLGTTTLSSDLNVVNLTINNASNTTVNGNNINLSGNLTQTSGNLIGTTTLNIIGSTNQTIAGNNVSYIGVNTVINSSGGIVYMGQYFGFYNGKTFTYTAGTVDCTTNSTTLKLLNSCTLNTNGINWYHVTFTGTGTYTLSSAMSVDGTLSVNNAVVATLATSDITASGNLTITGTGIITGRTIILDGTGTWSHTSTGTLKSNFTINTAGIITVSGAVYYNTGTLLHSAGTVITTGSTLTLTNTSTLSSGTVAWNNVSTATAGTVTLGTALDVNGTLNIGAGTTLSAAGFNINVGDDWTNSGTFTHGNNNVIFDTVANTSVISGTNTFYDLTCNTASKAIEIAASTTQTIAHTLTLNGQAQGTRITLDINGGTPGVDRFTFDVTGGAQAVTFVDVSDSNASTNNIVATDSKNSGNTDSGEAAPHWVITGAGSPILILSVNQ